ncbi:MAG TPA: diadenylate cyclase CdaA [Candidatus Dormibacteraeota bacterium]|nr:diadenylate cyclase CdaA [Candidatus Dormibacteraeota bacterium]
MIEVAGLAGVPFATASLNVGEAARVLLQTVGWRAVLDVLIIAFLAYRLLILIRGTQAVQLLLGLLLIGALAAIADILNLPVLKFIFSNGGQVILIAVVILFQPELRRALDQMGRLGRIRSGLLAPQTAELKRVVDEVVRASMRLAESATGALIVLQGGIGLEEIAATGVRMDAILSAETLITVFTYRSPLHDGAALIRDGRLVAAGCVLPLAEQTGSHGRVGTRHRAAIGLSQGTDAAVVIVSEESGRVSMALGGELERELDVDALTNRLGAFYRLPLYERHRRSLRLRGRSSREPAAARGGDGP